MSPFGGSAGSAPHPARLRAATVVGAALAFVAILLALTPGAAASAYGPTNSVGWTNGLVMCQFSSQTPVVSVSTLNITASGLTASIVGFQELAPNGTVVASTWPVSGWTVANLSTEDSFVLQYSASVPIVEGAGDSELPVGSTNVSIQFALPAYAGSPDGPIDTVAVQIEMGGWAAWNSGDHLILTLGAAPTFPSSEQLSSSAPNGWILTTVASGTTTVRERMAVNSTASLAGPAGGASTVVPVGATLDLVSGASATVSAVFPPQAGSSLPALSYGARVGIVVPSTVAGIPLPDLLAAVAAAGLVSVLVAVSVRRVRARPSRIIYADEEEP